MEYGYIYKTTNKLDNKIYIGQHKCSSKLDIKYYGKGKYISLAIKKYGKDNFINEAIVYVDDKEEADILETYYIKKYDCLWPKGYNFALGGEGGATRCGMHTSEETKKRISIGNSGKKRTPEVCEKYRLQNLGRKHTSEAIEKLRIASSGENNPMFGKSAMLGKKHSPESKEKMKLASQKYWQSDSGKAHREKLYSPEVIEKQKLSMKNYWQSDKAKDHREKVCITNRSRAKGFKLCA